MKSKILNNSLPYKRFQMGDLELTIVSDGYQVMKPIHPIFAPYVDPEIVMQILRDNFRSTEQVDLSIHILLIKKADKLIMIDSGLGNQETTSGYLHNALYSAGIKASDVTDIILTHCHLDHIGGLVDKEGLIAFPNASIHLAKAEYDFWKSENPDFSNSPMSKNSESLLDMISKIKNILKIIKPKLQLVNHDQILFECIELIAAPGHTPGHTILSVFSGKQNLLHIADLIHLDLLLFENPEWGFLFDIDFVQASITRRKVLEMATNNQTLILAYHLAWPGLGHVRHKRKGFEWIPEIYSTPFNK